ncbi:hypothetical protein [uncultured Selenomonas sp.]|uniref:hypothetical protein n=1 Tax=uncultured Selenomonas sp. TaxID=159275 RepID=UPI0025F1817B|nr:hypothetical protein [uncultured Selenomonas sp.]
MMAEAKLRGGVIFGDRENGEYVYLPASEVGASRPLCVYEADGRREDVTMEEAVRLITVRSLRPTAHPKLGRSAF